MDRIMAVCAFKDACDIEGDARTNVWTLPMVIGVRACAVAATGLLTAATYVAAVNRPVAATAHARTPITIGSVHTLVRASPSMSQASLNAQTAMILSMVPGAQLFAKHIYKPQYFHLIRKVQK